MAGANALRAKCSITAESLPMEYSMTGRSNSAATSRMMKILSASSHLRWVRENAGGAGSGRGFGADMAINSGDGVGGENTGFW